MKLALALILGLWPAWPVLAGAPVMPDTARPGAIRPGEERTPATEAAAGDESFKVPRVVDRPLDIDAGPKVMVTKFNLVDVVDRPEHDIKAAEVQALVDGKIKERPEGFTVGRLQEVANAVTQYYRGKGLILAQAFIPVQNVQGGVVNLQVSEGVLGRVVVEGNQRYDTDLITKPFDDLVGKPVTKDATESALLRLTDYPGLGLFGVFQPGQQVGTTDMVIKVQQEKRVEGNVRFDNYGLAETGHMRERAEVSWNNPTSSADKLTFSSQITNAPANLFFYNIDYERPVYSPENKASVGFNRTVFDVSSPFQSIANQQLSGKTENSHVDIEHSFIRSRQLNFSAKVGIERKQSITHVGTPTSPRDISRDDLAMVTTDINFDSVDSRFAGLNTAQVEYSHGFPNFLGAMGDQNDVNNSRPNNRPSRRGVSGNFASGEFDRLFVSASRLQSMSVFGKWLNKPDFFKGQSLLLRTEGQWSDDLLVPLEQYAVGGPTNVRAYPPTDVLFDKAIFFSAEYFINAPGIADKPAFGGKTWGELLQFSVFYDIAYGELNEPLKTDVASGDYDAIGLALSFANTNVFTSKFTVAMPASGPGALPTTKAANSATPDINRRTPQFWLDMNYFF